MECWVSSTEINSIDFVLPPDQHVPAIIHQNNAMFRRSAAALDGVLSEVDYLVEGRFSVTDIIVGYTLNFAEGRVCWRSIQTCAPIWNACTPGSIARWCVMATERSLTKPSSQHTGRASQTFAFCGNGHGVFVYQFDVSGY